MISFAEAKKLVLEQARSFGKDKIPLEDSFGRVLSETIVADRDYPPFNRAAMDGYAIHIEDWQNGVRLFNIRETIFAGNSHSSKISEGDCYKIMTGAAVPSFANAIIRREDVMEHSTSIECGDIDVISFQNIAPQGGDLKKGEPVFRASTLCSAPVIGLLASLGRVEVIVETLPKVTIITTGDEVVSLDAIVSPVQIRNSNRYVLQALLKKWNIHSTAAHVRDSIPEIGSTVEQALGSDILIMCGAVSAGDADHVPAVLQNLGAENIFHKVAIRPGKPLWFGKFKNGPLVFALPGNPLSCLVTFAMFLNPFLSVCFGLSEPRPFRLPLRQGRSKRHELDEFFPVSISGNPSHCEMIPFNGSGDITATISATAIARHVCSELTLQPGTIVDAYTIFG